MEYLPYSERPASTEYRQVLGHILDTGIETETRQGVNALTVMQQTMTFPLAQGFPVITERSIRSFWRKPIGELCAFINGATTLKEFESVRRGLVGALGDGGEDVKKGIEPGGIGPGSYGGAFHDFPTPDGAVRPVQAPGRATAGTTRAAHPLRGPLDRALPGRGRQAAQDDDRALPRLGPRPRARRRAARAHDAALG